MSRKTWWSAVILIPILLVAGIPLPAEAQPGRSCQEAPIPFTTGLAARVAESPTFAHLEELTRQLAHRAALVDPAELEEAYRTEDEDRIAELLGFTESQLAEMDASLRELRLAIFREFPELERHAAQAAVGSCGFSPSIARCPLQAALDAAPQLMEDGPLNESPNVECQWAQYTAALALCTLAGPVWYWPCAYLALCSYCRGGWVTASCF